MTRSALNQHAMHHNNKSLGEHHVGLGTHIFGSGADRWGFWLWWHRKYIRWNRPDHFFPVSGIPGRISRGRFHPQSVEAAGQRWNNQQERARLAGPFSCARYREKPLFLTECEDQRLRSGHLGLSRPLSGVSAWI